MDLDSDDEAREALAYTAADVAEVTRWVAERHGWIEPAAALQLGPAVSWRPDLVSPDCGAVLHVHLDTRLRSYVVARLRAASAQGIRVHVALRPEQLWSEGVLRALSDSRASILILREGSDPGTPLPLLRALAEEQINMPSPLRTILGREGWAACRASGLTKHQKGRLLEALLGFLLAQVDDFRVVDYNLRTDTEELDVVVQVSRLRGERCWVLPNHPFITIILFMQNSHGP